MASKDRIRVHDEDASSYDNQVEEFEYYGHEALFGMCAEYVEAGQSMLDLGIGTGLSSRLFARAGLVITGMDGSASMLEVCEPKEIAHTLIQADVTRLPWPLEDHTFDHVISSGLFHFFDDLAPMFLDVKRVIQTGGLFAFTVAVPDADTPMNDQASIQPVETPTPWGVPIYLHPYPYMRQLLQQTGFTLLKRQRLLVIGGPGDVPDIRYGLYITTSI